MTARNPNIHRPRLLACIGILTAFCVSVPAAMPVDPGHPVAPFLRRLEEKGLIAQGFWSTLPRDHTEIANALAQAEARSAELGAWDRRRLERHLDLFDPQRRVRGTVLHQEDPPLTLHGGVEFYSHAVRRDSVPASEGWVFGSLSPSIEVTYGEYLYFTGTGTVGMERNRHAVHTGNYDPQRGLPMNTARITPEAPFHGVNTFDAYRVVLGVGDGRFALEVGQDWNQWGPGTWQHATLGTRPHFWVSDSLPASRDRGRVNSQTGYLGRDTLSRGGYRRGYRYVGEGPAMPQIRFRIRGNRWEYVKIVAERKGMHNDSAAALVAHRLQLRFGNLTLGATELLAIGTRDYNTVLMLPGIPLKVAEHEGGDRDNAAMSMDAEYRIPGRGRVYGEFFFDDYSGPPLDFWGNKFSWLLGGTWHDPFGFPAELRAEYAQVDPWTYGHRRYNTALQHYGALPGSVLPPNSRGIFAAAAFPLPYAIDGGFEWRFRQHDVRSAGSSIFDDMPLPGASTRKQFLAQDVETRHEVMATGQWMWRRHFSFTGGLGGLWVRNWKGTPGVGLTTPVARGELMLRY